MCIRAFWAVRLVDRRGKDNAAQGYQETGYGYTRFDQT